MQLALPNPQWEGELRSCVICGAKDVPVYTGEADADGPIFDHKVVIDLAFIGNGPQLTHRQTEDGYLYKEIDGRHAMIRPVCRECLQGDEDTKEVWRDFRRARKKSEEKQDENYYQRLCAE